MKYVLIFLLTILNYNNLFSAPKSVYNKFWDQYNNNNVTKISHSEFNIFLSTYIIKSNDIHLVQYHKVTKKDKIALDNYIKKLANIPILSYSKSEQQAYWINLYNALTIQVILDNYPITSIKEAYSSILKTGPWNKKLLTIENQAISLNDIEHTILRPLWKDSRIHFLVNCASIGCPNLLLQAITSDTYDQVAEQATKDFINNSRAVSVENNKLILSSLFDWYGEDFGSDINQIITYIKKYANDHTKSKLKNYQKISYTYDWDLNEVH